MKKLLLVAALALVSSSAVAQSNQGRNTDSPGHPTANVPEPARPNSLREGTTTGMGAGQAGSPNGAPAQGPKLTTGPTGSPSKDETPAR